MSYHVTDGAAPQPTPHESTGRSDPHLVGHASKLGGLLLLSRVAALMRDGVLFHLFGAGFATDAFLIALLPFNALRKLIADGALSVAWVPTLVRVRRAQGDAAAQRLMQIGMGWALALGVGVAAVGIVTAPLWIQPMVRGFAASHGKLSLTITLSRWLLPWVTSLLWIGVAGAALNAASRFQIPGSAPLCFNLVAITTMIGWAVLSPSPTHLPIMAAVWAVALGSVAQVLLLARGLRSMGWPATPRAPWRIGAAERSDLSLALSTSVTTLGVIAAYPLTIAVVTVIGARLGEGTISYIYTADRFFQLPLGIVGVAVSMVALPSLAQAATGRDPHDPAVVHVFTQSARLMAFVAIPSAVGLAMLAHPIIASIMQHGHFDAPMAMGTANVLQAMAPSLIPLVGNRLMAQWCVVSGRSRQAIAAASVGIVSALIIAPVCAEQWGARGLGWSVSIAMAAQCLVHAWWLREVMRDHRAVLNTMRGTLFKSSVASGVMGCVIAVLVDRIGAWDNGSGITNIIWLGCVVILGVFVYGAMQWLLRAEELRHIFVARSGDHAERSER